MTRNILHALNRAEIVNLEVILTALGQGIKRKDQSVLYLNIERHHNCRHVANTLGYNIDCKVLLNTWQQLSQLIFFVIV
jgi:hypothetical protein